MIRRIGQNDIIYVLNVGNTESVQKQFLSFSSTNLGELLTKGDSYEVAVVYARFPVASIPLRSRFKDGQYTVSLNHDMDNVGFTEPLLNADSFNGTSFLFTYRNYCDMINGAFARAFTRYKTAYPSSVTTRPPEFTYDNEFQLFRIVYQDTYITDKINMWFNNPLQWNFRFNATRVTFDPTDPMDSPYPEINDYMLNYSGFRVLSAGINYNTQNFSTVDTLTDFKSFVLQTALAISPQYKGTNLNNNTSKSNNDFQNVLADVEVPFVSQAGQVSYKVDKPDWNLITDAGELKKIDVRFFYTNTSGVEFPLPFELYYSATIKLHFRLVHHRVTVN